MMNVLSDVPRYIVCARITKRPIFVFVSSQIHPNDALSVFPFDDDYSFGILQSGFHWAWFTERCSTLREDFRYTSNTVFNSFPWPQSPSKEDVLSVAKAARAVRLIREQLCDKHELSLRELYRSTELPGVHPLDSSHEDLDVAVRKAYGAKKTADPLRFLFELNQKLADSGSKRRAYCWAWPTRRALEKLLLVL